MPERYRLSSTTGLLFMRKSSTDAACCLVERGRGKHRNQVRQENMLHVDIAAAAKSIVDEAPASPELLGDLDQDAVLSYGYAEADKW